MTFELDKISRIIDDNIILGEYSIYSSHHDPLHPISLMNSELIMETLKDNRKIAVVTPNKYFSSIWAAALASFRMIKESYNPFESLNKYEIGQKILINGKGLARFNGWIDDGGISIKTEDSKYNIYKNFSGTIRAVDTRRPLSQIKKIMNLINKGEASNNPIDQILDIKTLGDTSFSDNVTFLVSKINASREFFNSRRINYSLINEIIGIGKINYNSSLLN